jgi:hypothetical protein
MNKSPHHVTESFGGGLMTWRRSPKHEVTAVLLAARMRRDRVRAIFYNNQLLHEARVR